MNRARRSGHALVGTMGFVTLAMFFWLVAFTQTDGQLRLGKSSQVRQDYSVGEARALAWAAALLETGAPPTNPYSCRMSPDLTRTLVATFKKTGEREYEISIRNAQPEDSSLPTAPSKFNGH